MSAKLQLARSMGGVAVAAASAFYVTKWEGVRYEAYRDMVGVPTICAGETLGVVMGMKATNEQCEEMTARALLRHWQGIIGCAPSLANAPAGYKVAMLDLAYNIGVGAWCQSSLRRLTEERQYDRACERTMQFVYAGGQKVRGLENRRRDLLPVCNGTRPVATT